MTEKITCPYCDRSFDLDQIETAGLWQERGDIHARIKPVWRIANEYMDAFRKRPEGRISLKRRVRHLWGLVRLWEGCEFELQGKMYRTNRESIKLGLLAVCEAQKVGFQNHNYLYKCLLPTAQRVSVEGLTAGEEEGREEDRRRTTEDGRQRTDPPSPRLRRAGGREEKPVTGAEFKQRRGIESLADGVGKEL